jgi:hypothetical protein
MNATSIRDNRSATIVVRLSAVWLLAGALAKLFLGTPKDLPEIIRKLTPFSLDLTFHLVIATELAIVWLCLLKPRWGWPVVLALLAFFEFVLGSQLSAGAESCGCFGATIKVSPYLMVAIDGVLALALLATRPWKTSPASGANPILLAAVVLVSAFIPWIAIPSQSQIGMSSQSGGANRRYEELHPEKWAHQNVFDLADLSRYVPPEKLPTDGKIVLWRQGCTHCAAHLRKLAREDDGSQPIVLLQIKDDLNTTREVDAMPSGAHVGTFATPDNLDIVVQTPWEVHVEGGVVKDLIDPQKAEELDGTASK